MQIYKGFEAAKNGTQIPVFVSGRTMESRYNPQRDAENLCNSINEESFFLVLGIGSGLFISLLTQKFPHAKIIGLELYDEDINFLMQQELLQKLKTSPNICFSNLDNISDVLSQNYIPAKYGNLKIIEQRGWVNENSAYIETINKTLQKALGIISADYSVQAHFGKIWNSNILNNAKLAENSQTSFSKLIQGKTSKTAVIVAAGPTLDKTINIISVKSSRDNYFIISTDTAAHSLFKRDIIPDVIISIDGQSVSYNHFLQQNKKFKAKPVYAFDLCANTSAARHVIKSGFEVLFFTSGHPLAAAINSSSGSPLQTFFSGAGTVTITAVDFAVSAGFSKILILGADFAYSDGKAYTNGTYLDTLYNKTSSRITESEQTFSKLMFRTELKTISQNIKTTSVLEAYKLSLEKYMSQKNITFTKEDDIYNLNVNQKQIPPVETESSISLSTFMNKLKVSTPEESEVLLLPYIAWLRNNKTYKNLPYSNLVKLALDSIISYNI